MDITKMIKKVMIDENIKQEVLAEKLNFSQANLSKKFKLNNFRIKELEEIAAAMGYKVEINFLKEDN